MSQLYCFPTTFQRLAVASAQPDPAQDYSGINLTELEGQYSKQKLQRTEQGTTTGLMSWSLAS